MWHAFEHLIHAMKYFKDRAHTLLAVCLQLANLGDRVLAIRLQRCLPNDRRQRLQTRRQPPQRLSLKSGVFDRVAPLFPKHLGDNTRVKFAALAAHSSATLLPPDSSESGSSGGSSFVARCNSLISECSFLRPMPGVLANSPIGRARISRSENPNNAIGKRRSFGNAQNASGLSSRSESLRPQCFAERLERGVEFVILDRSNAFHDGLISLFAH